MFIQLCARRSHCTSSPLYSPLLLLFFSPSPLFLSCESNSFSAYSSSLARSCDYYVPLSAKQVYFIEAVLCMEEKQTAVIIFSLEKNLCVFSCALVFLPVSPLFPCLFSLSSPIINVFMPLPCSMLCCVRVGSPLFF